LTPVVPIGAVRRRCASIHCQSRSARPGNGVQPRLDGGQRVVAHHSTAQRTARAAVVGDGEPERVEQPPQQVVRRAAQAVGVGRGQRFEQVDRGGRSSRATSSASMRAVQERWPELPRIRQRQPMVRATRKALQNIAEVIAFIEAGAPVESARQTPMLETMYSYLATLMLTGRSLADLPELDVQAAPALEGAIRAALEATEIDSVLVERHAGISPAAMQRLLEHFRTYDDPAELVLALPESTDATNTYSRALALSDEELGSDFGSPARHFQLALLITSWMRGQPLARLIMSRVEYLRRNDRPIKLPYEIRDVMRDVEQVARFKAPKCLACYSDVLGIHVGQVGRDDLQDVPNISMMLELGVSRITRGLADGARSFANERSRRVRVHRGRWAHPRRGARLDQS
jgi:hypothetical protein